MQSIAAAAYSLAKRRARVITVRCTVVFGFVLLFALYAYTLRQVDIASSVVQAQLSHLIKLGDEFQIRNALRSLRLSSKIDAFSLREKSGTVLAADGAIDELKSGGFFKGALKYDPKYFAPFVVRELDFKIDEQQTITLQVAKRLPLEWLLGGVVFELMFFLLVLVIFRRSFSGFIQGLIEPTRLLAKVIRGTKDLRGPREIKDLSDSFKFQEIVDVHSAFTDLLDRLDLDARLIQRMEHDASLAKITSQIAHDIRSPLAALDIIFKQSAGAIPQEHRAVARQSLQRISDIARNIIHPQPAVTEKSLLGAALSNEHIPTLVESVLSERRVQLQDLKDQVKIVMKTDGIMVEAFALVEAVELKRALSNLIGNAVEAVQAKGAGTVGLSVIVRDEAFIEIICEDNGVGIPKSVLPFLGSRGYSYGKQNFSECSGSGLGLYHARKVAEEHGGALNVESELNVGTRITLSLRRAKPANWFISNIVLKEFPLIAVVDDDLAIIEFWKTRFQAEANRGIMSFQNPSDFASWLKSRKAHEPRLLALIDYEFSGYCENGFDLISLLNPDDKAILGTNRADDPGVRARCEDQSISLLPKMALSSIQISA